jgi:hypothetical protein
MAAKAARGAALERSASQASTDSTKDYSKGVIKKADLGRCSTWKIRYSGGLTSL